MPLMVSLEATEAGNVRFAVMGAPTVYLSPGDAVDLARQLTEAAAAAAVDRETVLTQAIVDAQAELAGVQAIIADAKTKADAAEASGMVSP